MQKTKENLVRCSSNGEKQELQVTAIYGILYSLRLAD